MKKSTKTFFKKKFYEGDLTSLTKLTLIIVGVIIFVTGIACIPGVSHMVKEPDWHAYLKVVIDLVAPVIPFGDKE